MEDNKYYTPDISEFHVGFEYEENRFGGPRHFFEEGHSWDNAWTKVSIEEDWATPPILSQLNDKCIRVPYLTKEDIEAEGYSVVPMDQMPLGTSHDVVLATKTRTKYNDTLKITIIYNTNTKWTTIAHRENDDPYDPVFAGSIKNKSELRRILKMIGV